MKKAFFISLLIATFCSCGKIDLYEKQAQIPSQKWFYNNVPEFSFHISDTASLYNIYVVLMHTDLYGYNNIWLRVGSRAPEDSMSFQNLNIRLTEGASWKGTGMDNIYEIRELISPGPVSFNKLGDYDFTIAQIMRENPLNYILNVGLRIEKIPN
ncbi:MAG: gliding motility lipoprotein GldH [Ginsengibacter sp.]